jgi:tRNA (mo5U34)-methyltransferase
MTSEQIEQRVRALGDWFHNLDLHGVKTAPEHFLGDFPKVVWRYVRDVLPDVRGKTVLDIGCNGGFYSLELKRRGARRVVGIDVDERYLAQARLASEILGLELELHRMSVYQVPELGERFDVVLFMGVLYHLRHPLLAIDLIREHVAGDMMILQTMVRGSRAALEVEDDYPIAEEDVFDEPAFPRMHFIEKRFSGDPTNWWIPNRACVEAMIRSAGFEVLDRPHSEIFVCRTKDGRPDGANQLVRVEG